MRNDDTPIGYVRLELFYIDGTVWLVYEGDVESAEVNHVINRDGNFGELAIRVRNLREKSVPCGQMDSQKGKL